MLSKRFQISKSLAEECEAVGEARPPRRVARISGFHWCRDGSFLLSQHWSRGSMIVGVRLEGDSPVLEGFRWLLGLAAGRGLWRGPAFVTTAQSWWLAFSFSPRWCWCSVVLCAFCLCGVCFGALCTNIFSSYMTEQCSCYYFLEKRKVNVDAVFNGFD